VTTEAGKKAAGAQQAPGEVGLLQSKLNNVLAVDPVKSTMRVGAGMTVGGLLKAATQNKMSVQVRRPISMRSGLHAKQGMFLCFSFHGSSTGQHMYVFSRAGGSSKWQRQGM
jgi:FAD/FMN-containing dehydrogenase